MNNLPRLVKFKLTPIWETNLVFEIVLYFNYNVKKQNKKLLDTYANKIS